MDAELASQIREAVIAAVARIKDIPPEQVTDDMTIENPGAFADEMMVNVTMVHGISVLVENAHMTVHEAIHQMTGGFSDCTAVAGIARQNDSF